MFKRIMESRKSMERRIAELEASNESLYKIIETYINQKDKLREEVNYWQERYESVRYEYNEYVNYVEEQKEVMEDYLYVIKEKLEEAEGAEEYAAELEEELFKANPNHVLVRGMAQYYGERDAIEVSEYEVVEEPLLLMAPAETVKTTITTTVMTTITTEKSDGSITTETITTTKKEVIDSRIKKALRGFKENVSKSEVRRTPPLPPHRRKAC